MCVCSSLFNHSLPLLNSALVVFDVWISGSSLSYLPLPLTDSFPLSLLCFLTSARPFTRSICLLSHFHRSTFALLFSCFGFPLFLFFVVSIRILLIHLLTLCSLSGLGYLIFLHPPSHFLRFVLLQHNNIGADCDAEPAGVSQWSHEHIGHHGNF
jgi:hypothetical protein